MKILSHQQFTLETLPKEHPLNNFKSRELYDDNIEIHQGLVKIPIEDAINAMPYRIFMCTMLDQIVINYMGLSNLVLDKPDHDPSTLFTWIQKSLNLPEFKLNKTWTYTDLIHFNHPLQNYLKNNNLLAENPSLLRLKLLQHIHSLGITEVEFEFLFVTNPQ